MIGDAMAEVPRAGRRCPVPCRVAVRRRSPGAVSRRAGEAIVAAPLPRAVRAGHVCGSVLGVIMCLAVGVRAWPFGP
jgi:hypothetical protein